MYPALEAELTKRGQAVEIVKDPPVAFFAVWFGQVGLRRLAQMALQWRDAYRQFSLDRLGLDDPKAAASLEWSSIVENATGHSHGYYRVIELTSRQALELEGREQEHCVASYAVKCLTGDSALFSIRARSTGKIQSTFEVDLRRDSPVLIKHYAQRNETPEPPLQAVAERFVQCVLQPLPKTHLSAIRARRRRTGATIIHRLDSPDSQESELSVQDQHTLAEMLAFTLPAQARREGVGQFVERKGLLHLLFNKKAIEPGRIKNPVAA